MRLAGAILGFGLAVAPAWAQAPTPAPAPVPTPAEADAIRATCGGDFMKNCRGVPRGGMEVYTCLRDHQDKLTPACRKAVVAVQ